MPDGEYKIVDDEGNVVKEGETGELIISSKSISKGYFKNPEQTQKSIFLRLMGNNGIAPEI